MSAAARSAIVAAPPPTTPTPRSMRALIDHIQTVGNTAALAALTDTLTTPGRPMVVSFVNQHAINVAWRDPAFATLLRNSDLLLRDGVGASFCLRVLGRDPGLNMNGTDFIPVLAAAHAGRRVVLYGTRQPWLGIAAAAFARMGCDVVDVIDGFQPDAAYVAAARAHRPDMLILAMGMPKQERVAAAIAQAVDTPMLILSGGAIADFIAGRFPRAPRWMRRLGLEWAFRLCREPARLWRRYVIGGFLFAVRVLRLRLERPGRASEWAG